MKKKDLNRLRDKSISELEKLASGKKIELAKVLADLKVSKESNLKKAKNMRAEVSQILTLKREKEIVEAQKPKKKGDQ